MSTIVKKIIIITMCAVLLAFTVFAGADTVTFYKILRKVTDDKVFYETNKFANQLSMVFENAEGSVDAICAEVGNSFDMDRQANDPGYINEYMEEYAPVIKDALRDIEDSQGLYITFNPDITSKQRVYEIWYSYDERGKMKEMDALENGIYYEAFEDRSLPHMQYYFEAAASRDKGVWTEPSMDPDVGEEVLTYSRAVYVGDTLIGVVGTDIYTKHTVDLISDMKVDNNGMIVLFNGNNTNIAASDNKKMREVLGDKDLWKKITAKAESEKNGVLEADVGGKAVRASFSGLSNGWGLAILNYEKELYRAYESRLIVVIILSLVLLMLLLAAIFITLRHLSDPVDKAVKMLRLMELENQIGENDAVEIKDEKDIAAIVKKAIKRQRMKDIMLANRSRQAAAGEMMANLIHQWKQPLNNINIIMGTLKDEAENGEIDDEGVLLAVSKVEKLTTGMSETLSDFSDYLKPDTKLVEFDVVDVACSAAELLKDRIMGNRIALSINSEDSLVSYGYKNSLYHVILNVLGNAIDAIEEKGTGDGKIDIDIRRDDIRKIRINIFNNGVQLTESEQDNLFKPYYTTKEKNNGTGLGLALSKHLVEESMDGKISLNNCSNGVLCVIIINAKEEADDE